MKTLKEVKEEHIRKVLEESGWDTKEASHILQVSEKLLMSEIKKYDKAPTLPHIKKLPPPTQNSKKK
jgi:DNA-binding NtrC family response regulator